VKENGRFPVLTMERTLDEKAHKRGEGLTYARMEEGRGDQQVITEVGGMGLWEVSK